jgi:hypothetical protein
MDFELDGKIRGLAKGEKTWMLRQFDDSKPRLYYPHELLDKFVEYQEWMEDNPLYEQILHQKSGQTVRVPRMRAMTIKGFCLFAGIAQNTFYGYAKKPEDAVYVQKFEGASAGLLNTNIIVRDLGLSDTVKHNISDDRKSVDELFPSVEDIEAVEVEETDLEYVKKLNEHGKSEED